jgi:endonuclease/exonuclease/phosphatase family metal-dependent hydrolase
MVYCHLEEKNSTLKFVAAGVHLKGLFGTADQEKRLKQASKVNDFFKTQYADVPVILCGDLNDVPGSRALKTLESDFEDFSQILKKQNKSLDKESAYPDFTVVKVNDSLFTSSSTQAAPGKTGLSEKSSLPPK